MFILGMYIFVIFLSQVTAINELGAHILDGIMLRFCYLDLRKKWWL